MRYKITIEYDGTYFNGWQRQNNCSTIQGEIEKALLSLTGSAIEIFASGRTDVGVHAINQIAHFDSEKHYETTTIEKALNHYLSMNLIKRNIMLNNIFKTKQINYLNSNSIVIKNCEVMDENFHARFSTKKRIYRYIILNQKESSPFYFNRAWHVRKKLDLEKMTVASKLLLGKHDFTSFRSSDCQAKSAIKTLDSCEIKTLGNEIVLDFTAKSFLHNMVRNMVGTLKEIGIGKISVDDIDKIFLARNRTKAGELAPACGLYLLNIVY